MNRLRIPRPDDWHLHLRDGDMLASVLADTVAHFGRAIIMPNILPPVLTAADAQSYRSRILAAIPAGLDFQPLMTLYLTETTDPDDVISAAASGQISAVKLYPAGATTNSGSGVRDFDRVTPVLDAMADNGIPLCVHGEVTDPDIDIFDREAVFLERILDPLRERIKGLRVVLEHVTTCEGVDYVRQGGNDLAATITTHHLFINRNHILAGGIRPHNYCLPVAKREVHRLALVAAATSGDPSFFLGTDSAPHVDAAKQSGCGCAGIFTAPITMSCLATLFESEGALEKLEGFVSRHGPAFYRLPINTETLTLVKREAPIKVPEKLKTPDGPVTIFDCGQPLYWAVETS